MVPLGFSLIRESSSIYINDFYLKRDSDGKRTPFVVIEKNGLSYIQARPLN